MTDDQKKQAIVVPRKGDFKVQALDGNTILQVDSVCIENDGYSNVYVHVEGLKLLIFVEEDPGEF